MKKHVKNYMNHYKYGEQDMIICEYCMNPANDIHHLVYKSHGGTDEIHNLIALCRTCHLHAHNHKDFNLHLIKLKNKEFNIS